MPIYASTIDSVHICVFNRPEVGMNPTSIGFTVEDEVPYIIKDEVAMAWSVGENYYISEPMVDDFEAGNLYFANVKVDIKNLTVNRFDEDLRNVIIDGVDEDDLVLYRIADDGSYVELVIEFKVEDVLSGSVSISGSANVDEQLAVDPSSITNQKGSLEYQWYLDDVAIQDATDHTNRVQEKDAGHEISVLVTSTQQEGKLRSNKLKIVDEKEIDKKESNSNIIPIISTIVAFVVGVIMVERKKKRRT